MKAKDKIYRGFFFLAIVILAFSCEKEKQKDEVEIEFPQSVTDYDGNVYDVVVIGQQAWMKQNLRVTHYSDGSPVATGLLNEQWRTTSSGAYSIYPHQNVPGIGSDEQMKDIYGLLYNWHAVSYPRGLCPAGWRIPSEPDWFELKKYVLEKSDTLNESNLGNALKCCRQLDSPLGGDCSPEFGEHPYWYWDDDYFGLDLMGFSAIASGTRSATGDYTSLNWTAFFWESTYGTEITTAARYIFNNSGEFNRHHLYFVNNGFSVRCIWTGD